MFTYKKYKSVNQAIYQDSLILRNELLRVPIGKSLFDEDLTIEKDNDFYGVFKDNTLIGTLSFFEAAPKIAQLTAFAVDANFQRKGLGQGLVAFLASDLKRRGYQKLIVDARATAKDFYQKCGFIVVEGPIVNQHLGVEDYKMVYSFVQKN